MAPDPSKTEKATPKRRNKARGEGNVPKSQEVSKTATILTGLLILQAYMGSLQSRMSTIFVHYLGNAHNFNPTPNTVYSLLLEVGVELAILLLPILLAVGFAAYLSIRLQVGKLWTTKVFKFKWVQFNLFGGLKRMFFSPDTFVRLGKSALLAGIIGIIPYRVIVGQFDNIIPLFNATPAALAAYILTISATMVKYTLIPMVVIAGVDLWRTRYKYEENLKMSKDEVKDEAKQSEGDQMIKGKMRQKMMQVMMQRMMEDVPKADVVITNPTHIAVALRYDATECPAPVVVAIGADRIAEKIKEIARKHNVPIRENVPLARALYKSVDVGDMIPEELYKAVASILAEIWRIKGRGRR